MEKPNYYRRCHMCGNVTHIEDDHHIEACEHCGKHWARFFYFDDRLSPIISDRTLRAPPLQGAYTPINGLTVYWESF